MPALSTADRLSLYHRGLLAPVENACTSCGGVAGGVTLQDRRGMCQKCWHLTPEGMLDRREKCRIRVAQTRARQRANQADYLRKAEGNRAPG